MRGGGGDFGIITRMEVALHPAPEVYGGRMLWPIEQMGDVLRTFKAVTEEAPNELTIWYHTYQFPPMPEIPEPIRGKGFAAIAVAYLGNRADAEALLAPFRALPGLAMDLMGEVPLAELSSIADEPTDPMPAMQRSALLTGLDDDAIDALVAVVGADSGSPLPVVQIRHLGGAFADTVDGGGAHGPVSEPYNLFALGVPAVPELVEVIGVFFGRISAAVAHVSSGRTLLNFLDGTEDPGALVVARDARAPAPREAGLGPAADDPQQPPGPGLSPPPVQTNTREETEMNKQTINPWTWQDQLGYAQGVLVTEPRQTLYAAGQGSMDADGNLVDDGDVAGQAAQAMDNVETVLAAAGMTLADVVRYDIHATDLQDYFMSGGHEQVAKRFGQAGNIPAGGIATEVPALAVPGMAVEITVIACH